MLVLTVALLLQTAIPQEPPLEIVAGPLHLSIRVSRTANLFHIVDQLSNWSEFCHRQYRSRFIATDGEPGAADRAMLALHQEVRAHHGWGQGLEQTFYTPLDLDAALAAAIVARRIDETDAARERRVLQHFAARIDALMEEEQARLTAFHGRIAAEGERLKQFAGQLARFTGTPQVAVPIYLIADPADHDCGGGFNGDRLVLEVPRQDDAMPILLHELMHAFLKPQRPLLTGAVTAISGLSVETLDEGICYALAPGIHHDMAVSDPLATEVANDLATRASLDSALVRYRHFGLALRPLLQTALEDEHATLASFVPRALDAYRVVIELDRARRTAWRR